MNREELLEQLNSKRLSRDSITTALIFDFFAIENEEKLIRGMAFSAEITHMRVRYEGKIILSTKYKRIAWEDGATQYVVDYRNKKFSPIVKLKEGLIQLNNDVSLKIDSVIEFNVVMLLIIDADKKIEAGNEYVFPQKPDKFEIDKFEYKNAKQSESIMHSGIRVLKFNNQFDQEWKYYGKVRWTLNYKSDAITMIMEEGEMYHCVEQSLAQVGKTEQKAIHNFKRTDNLLLGYDAFQNMIVIYTNGILSNSYGCVFDDKKDAVTFGIWLLKAFESKMGKSIDIYLRDVAKQKANNSYSGSENINESFNSEDEIRYIGLFVDMVKYYPISIRDKRTFEASISDIFPGNRKITIALSALYEDGILSRLNNLDFVAMNQQILVEKYGIQKDVAYLASVMWNKAKEHICDEWSTC